uniref:Uncharacterized protein n=1 Tax=Sphaerodactylus townsendi TaxID=933632 RepID=A0ACB8G5D6_9SAUR
MLQTPLNPVQQEWVKSIHLSSDASHVTFFVGEGGKHSCLTPACLPESPDQSLSLFGLFTALPIHSPLIAHILLCTPALAVPRTVTLAHSQARPFHPQPLSLLAQYHSAQPQ